MPNLTGQSLGRYHILEQLGEGGMATVYKAYDTRLERDVALKIIRTDQFAPAALERILKRFEREAKALARLTHPNIVSVIDYGEYESAPYLVMTYLPGGTLKSQLGKSMLWQEAVKLLLPIAGALDYAHSQNIIHRDVKPSNILLTGRGQPMLTDFGIAKILDLEDGQTLTGTGVGIGTPEYMSPEQGLGQPVDSRTDVYSLGVVLYELVTGRKPYTANTPMAVVVKHLHDPLPRPGQFASDLPEAVEKVIFKALAKQPEDRYVSMSEMAAALEKLSVGQDRSIKEEISNKEEGKSKKERIGAPEGPGQMEEKRKGEEETRDVPVPAAGGGGIPGGAKIPPVPPARTPPHLSWWQRWGAWLGIGGAVLAVLAVVTLLGLWTRGYIGPRPFVSPVPTRAPMPTETLAPSLTPVPTRPPRPTETTIPTPTLTPSPAFMIGSTWTRPADGMLMVYVPAGDFSMGSSNSGDSDEKPVHTVSLDAYWIDKTEVTNAMYEKCVSAGACQAPASTRSLTHKYYYGNPQFDNYPIAYSTWDAAQSYCMWAGARLPTEAEWEKAARGTDGRIYPWGNDSPSSRLLNYFTIYDDTIAVGSFPSGASPYGVLDMAGNVWEWVNDWYDAAYYANSPSSNPQGPASGQNRVVRGGAWYVNVIEVRSSNRIGDNQANSYFSHGFRCSRSP